MQSIELNKAIVAWPELAGMLHVPHDEQGYDRLVSFLDSLIDEVGENEAHPLASLMEVLGVLIEKYEDEHVPQMA